jgi:hypothetical protein
MEMNEQVRNMVATYPELLSKVEDLGNGIMGFSDKTKDEI